MIEKGNAIKLAVCAMFSFIAERVAAVGFVFVILCVLMALDYATGYIAARNNNEKSSKMGWKGIGKKGLYIIVIIVAMLLDMLILHYTDTFNIVLPVNTFFGTMVSLWFVFNEMISILENCVKLGIPVPTWLMGAVKSLKIYVDKKAEEETEKL